MRLEEVEKERDDEKKEKESLSAALEVARTHEFGVVQRYQTFSYLPCMQHSRYQQVDQ